EEQLARRPIGVDGIGGQPVQIGARRAEGVITGAEFFRPDLLHILRLRKWHAQKDRLRFPSAGSAGCRVTVPDQRCLRRYSREQVRLRPYSVAVESQWEAHGLGLHVVDRHQLARNDVAGDSWTRRNCPWQGASTPLSGRLLDPHPPEE